jgi:hypothetical protein
VVTARIIIFNEKTQSVMAKNIVRGYYDEAYPPVPTKTTIHVRRNIFWQAIQFITLNIKILRIVAGGHS